MEISSVKKTQELWGNYPNTKYWIKTISEPAKHMTICDQQIVAVDADYMKAVESLSYILSGNEVKVTLAK